MFCATMIMHHGTMVATEATMGPVILMIGAVHAQVMCMFAYVCHKCFCCAFCVLFAVLRYVYQSARVFTI